MTRHRSAMVVTLSALVLAGAIGVVANAAELLGTHADWKIYRHGTGGESMCFAVTEASEANPAAGERQAPHVYITAWPKAGISAEISVLVGLALKEGAEIKVEVDGTRFELFSDGDRAYVGDANEELRLLEAMRRGKSMTVSATSEAGKATRDSYSLSGVTAAVRALEADCW
jgi:invasion protein IalB